MAPDEDYSWIQLAGQDCMAWKPYDTTVTAATTTIITTTTINNTATDKKYYPDFSSFLPSKTSFQEITACVSFSKITTLAIYNLISYIP